MNTAVSTSAISEITVNGVITSVLSYRHNGAIFKIDAIDEITDDNWDWINAVNLRGPFMVTRALAPKMKSQKFGRIINVSSIFSVVSKEKRTVYSTTKWGLIGFTKAVALDLAPYDILVNAVSPY